ncbi:MAG: hypothetical protein Q7U47_13315 [Paludibacter sp.]|nr:hypothetical protein [Paludibacter sp.]
MEKLKSDENRINTLKLTVADNAMPNVSGGYITKADKTTGGDTVAWTMTAYNGASINLIHESPKPAEITTQQNTYIFNVFNSLRSVMTAQNSSILTGYPSIIDVPSFVDFYADKRIQFQCGWISFQYLFS